jgi:hypothetical protein
MDAQPIQRIAPIEPQPAGTPASRPTGDSADFASELLEALRGGGTASNLTAPRAADPAAASQPGQFDLAAADPFGFGSDGSISTVTITTQTEQLEAQFTARLNSLFAEHGIDTSVPIELRSDTHGRIRVVGDHPDAAKIEALFADSFELQQTFTRISSAQSLLRAATQHEAFATAYADDPQGATIRFAHLFGDTAPEVDFRLTLTDDEWTTRFE